MGIFNNLKKLTDVVGFLAAVDREDISRAMLAVGVIQDEARTIRDRVKAALDLADVVTDYVPGEVDDLVVDAIATALESDVIWRLVDSVSRLEDLGKSTEGLEEVFARTYADEQEGDGVINDRAEMVPWPLIVQLSIWAVRLIREARKRRREG